MKKVITVLALLLLLACAKQTPQPQQITEVQIIESQYPDKPQYEPPPSAPDAVEVQEIKIDAKRFDFFPNEIKVKKGQRVKLIILSQDTPHTFTMPAYGINEALTPGYETVIEFNADKEGQHTFYCKITGHEAMKGKFIVS